MKKFLCVVNFRLAFVGALLAGAVPGTALADNAVPIAVKNAGMWQILFFSHESPVRAGVVELSVMLLDKESGDPLPNWQLTGSIKAETFRGGRESAWVSPCCRIAVQGADGKSVPLNFQRSRGGNAFAVEATTILPKSGRWKLDVQITVPGHIPEKSGIVIDVARPRAPLEVYWAWFAAIPFVIGAYAWSIKK
jgi:hypothetical protein